MAAVELAIVFPVMLLLLYGLITFAAAFYTQLAVSRAVEDGARAVPFLSASANAATRASLIRTQIIDSLSASSIVPVASGATMTSRKNWLEANVRSRITVLEQACAAPLAAFTCFTITLNFPYGNADGTRVLPSINLFPFDDTESWMPDALSSRAVAQIDF